MSILSQHMLREFLEEKVSEYNRPNFIIDDPISIPHCYIKKEDIEIAAFLTATIAWGNRKMIINNARRMMTLLDDTPYDFVMNHHSRDLSRLDGFVHRTFNDIDFKYFIVALQYLYKYHGGLEACFSAYSKTENLQTAITKVRTLFFELPHPTRSCKHFSNPQKGSAAKRINMFLRWMVRSDSSGVDFGIWRQISPSDLSCPLDIHSGRVARALGLLKRKQNDQKAVNELDISLRDLDAEDPVKYDFALFGLGIFDKFCS